MRLLDYLTGLVSVLALPFIAWWGVNQSPQSAAALEARLQARAAEALVLAGNDWARVTMDGQTAVLSGAAPSEDAVDDAVATVLRSSGAGGVFFGGVAQVKTQVEAAAPVYPYEWAAEKQADGGLVLSGHVPSRAARAALLEAAGAVSEGQVADQMTLAPGAPGGNWLGMARFAIEQAAALDSGRAALSDTAFTLRGEQADDALRARLALAARSVAAPYRGMARIEGPVLWGATRTGDRLVLSGAVPSEADRRTLAALARRSFGGEVADEMTVAALASADWVTGAAAGLVQFAAFASGRMSFDAATDSFVFVGEAASSTLEFLSEDMAGAQGSWTFAVDAAPPAPAVGAASLADAPPNSCAEDLALRLAQAAAAFEPGRAEFGRAGAPALDALAGAARRCDRVMAIELTAGGDALDEARAAAMADFLERAGAQRPKVAAIGYGPAASVEGMDTERGRVTDPQIDFTIRERSGQ